MGGAVVRNKVRARLRNWSAGYLESLPEGSLLVVRANPRAATARQADLAAELDLVIQTLLRRQGGTLRRDEHRRYRTSQRAARERPSAAAAVLLLLIGGYRRFISPMLAPGAGSTRHAAPTRWRRCSVHGALRGSWLAARI